MKIELRIEKGVLQTWSVCNEKIGSIVESPKAVKANENFQIVILKNALNKLRLPDRHYHRKELEMHNRALEEQNGKLLINLNEYKIADLNLERTSEKEILTIMASLRESWSARRIT